MSNKADVSVLNRNLINAIIKRDFNQVKKIIGEGADVNYIDEKLIFRIEYVNRDFRGGSPLFFAMRSYQTEWYNQINWPDPKTASDGPKRICYFLIKKGAKLEMPPGFDGSSLLSFSNSLMKSKKPIKNAKSVESAMKKRSKKDPNVLLNQIRSFFDRIISKDSEYISTPSSLPVYFKLVGDYVLSFDRTKDTYLITEIKITKKNVEIAKFIRGGQITVFQKPIDIQKLIKNEKNSENFANMNDLLKFLALSSKISDKL